uniref:Auxin-responsive protein SAUR36 n=1 Tax=Aegilops tauschii subsp. strangulata TaxID=200361 RepID=A0A453LIF9_AEGTS
MSTEETRRSCGTSCSSVAGKGHCVVYAADGARFEVPIVFLETTIFGELLRMSQEEFGFAGVCHVLAQEKRLRRHGGRIPQHHGDAMPLSCGPTFGSWPAFRCLLLLITISSTSGGETGGPCGTSCSPVAGKGHFVVYTTDGARFEVPLVFLGTTVFDELLRMSPEEFGFTGVDGDRITLPCDASMMEYALCLLRRSASSDMEAAFLNTMAMPCHYHAEPHLGVSQHNGVCSS